MSLPIFFLSFSLFKLSPLLASSILVQPPLVWEPLPIFCFFLTPTNAGNPPPNASFYTWSSKKASENKHITSVSFSSIILWRSLLLSLQRFPLSHSWGTAPQDIVTTYMLSYLSFLRLGSLRTENMLVCYTCLYASSAESTIACTWYSTAGWDGQAVSESPKAKQHFHDGDSYDTFPQGPAEVHVQLRTAHEATYKKYIPLLQWLQNKRKESTQSEMGWVERKFQVSGLSHVKAHEIL